MKRVRGFRQGVSGSSREEREQSHGDFARPLTRALNGELAEPSMTPDGKPVSGNTSGKPVRVEFQRARTPTPAAHGLGYTVDQFRVIRKAGPGDVYVSSRRPTRDALWLECTEAPLTVDVVVFGEKRPEPPRVIR